MKAMKKALEFSRSLQRGTKRVVYIGMLLSILLMLTGTIIQHFNTDFNPIFTFFPGDEMSQCGRAVLVCTIVTAAMFEICLRQIHNEKN